MFGVPRPAGELCALEVDGDIAAVDDTVSEPLDLGGEACCAQCTRTLTRPRPARACSTSGVRVDTTMPSAQTVEHDVCSFAIFSILTMQTRQEPSMPIPG